MKVKIKKDCKFRDKDFEKGKSYDLSPKEYRCLKAMGVLEAPKKNKKDSTKEVESK